ncbi:hypothetical protein J6590_044220 [Homalodisca vitripennis]|nr:hypothetical protein J6590_044220 [Homalodisca vitripennis]
MPLSSPSFGNACSIVTSFCCAIQCPVSQMIHSGTKDTALECLESMEEGCVSSRHQKWLRAVRDGYLSRDCEGRRVMVPYTEGKEGEPLHEGEKQHDYWRNNSWVLYTDKVKFVSAEVEHNRDTKAAFLWD